MATWPRMAPVVLITLLGVTGPTGLPPGSSPGKTPLHLTAKCPNSKCGRGRWQPKVHKYRCTECRRFFNYCDSCQSPFWDEESKEHIH